MLLPRQLNNSATWLESTAVCSNGLVIGRTGEEGGVKGRARMTRGKTTAQAQWLIFKRSPHYIYLAKGSRINESELNLYKIRKLAKRFATNLCDMNDS